MAISRFNTPIQNTLEQYVPLPFQEMAQAAQSIQQRGDLAEQQQAQVELGLASMEALTPGYQKFRDNYVKDYKAKASELLDKYGSNTSDPEFIRNIKRLNLQFSSDPRLQIVKQGNEQYKQNQQLSANMKAQGKLFIAPEQTGLDANGNLTSNLGQVEGVNTLENWSKSGQIAHSSMVDDGRGNKSNAPNLNNWKKAITSDVDGQRKLVQAYISQGYTPEQATQAVKTEIQGLVNQYGVRSDKSFEWERLQLAYQEAADRKAAVKAKAQADGIKETSTIKAPSFNEFNNRVGSVGSITNDKGQSISTVFGSGNSQYGTNNVGIKNQKISGKIYDISNGGTKPVSTSIDVSEGTLKGYSNVWVNKSDGTLLQGNAGAKQQPKIEYINGKPYAFKNGKPYEIEERTVAQYDYKDENDKLKTFYKEAAPKEALKEMGYSNAYYRGMSKPNHGAVIDSKGNARLDYQFIVKNISNDREDLIRIKNAEKAFNNKTATNEQKELLKLIESYDNRKSIYDNEILPYFDDQNKTPSIVKED